MFSNTTALDIAIGLVLVYFIYSLLVSIVGEMIVSWTGIRARTLRQGISNLLTDHQPSSVDFYKWLADVFMKEPGEFKYTTAGRFYQEPTIRNLAKRGENLIYTFRNTKPGYISKEAYARTLLNMFNRRGRGVTERERVFMSVDTNALHLEPETDKRFKEMLVAANGDYVVFTTNLEDDFEQMMDRVNGWYKRKLGFVLFWLGFFICAVLNVNTFEIVKILSNNPKARAEMVKIAQHAVENGVPVERLMNTHPDSAGYDAVFKETYVRAFQDAQNIETLLAKGWVFPEDSQRIEIKSQDTVRLKEIIKKGDTLKLQIAECALLIASLKPSDSVYKTTDSQYKKFVEDYRANVLKPLSDTLNTKRYRSPWQREKHLTSVGAFENKTKAELQIEYKPSFFSKALFLLIQILCFWKAQWWGIALSALALSLGANFWFDLLKKLVSLRSAGVKPEEKKEEAKPLDAMAKAKKDGTYVEINDPIEKALSENRKTWENIPGVVAVNRGKFNVAGQNVEGIEVVKDSSYFDKSIPNIVSVQIQNTPITIHVGFKNGLVASLNPGENDDGQDNNYIENCIIHNSTKSWGTATGWVKDKDENRALLSCGHALRSDASGYIKENMDKVSVRKNGKNVPLGTVTNLFLTNYLDMGLVKIDSGANTNICKEIARVESVIRKKDPVKIITLQKEGQPKDGQIESISWNNRFDTSNQQFIMYNLILIHFSNQNDVTAPGDSGSLIMDVELKTAIAIHIGQVTLTDQKYALAVGLHEVFKVLNLKTF